MTFAGLFGDRAAITAGSAVTDIFSFQANRLHRLPATALAGIALAALTAAVRAATAKYSQALFNGQNMHGSEICAAIALARLICYKVAFAVILTVADVIGFAFIGG